MTTELLPIDDEVQRRLAEARAKSTAQPESLGWTEEDQAKLEEELARIKFVPEHANPDFSDRTVVFGGRELPVHYSNNFAMILGIVDTLRQGIQPKPKSFEAMYSEDMTQRRYLEIFGKLESEFPALYKRILQLDNERRAKIVNVGLSDDDRAEREYIRSQGYSAAAQIAKSIDPEYDLGYLYR